MLSEIQRGTNLEEDLDIFLGALCVEWGFCSSLGGDDLIREGKGTVTAEDFAKIILVAEKMPPDSEWHARLAEAFQNRYHFISINEQKYLESQHGN